ncbi:MAG TPA: 2-oxoglutarate dehydrogenase E1 component, partial [Ferruginibacter sp.]|nr:2-oxoglutarate dehydrogenase E1 component [Ferruginibacter sp.]
MKDFQYITSSHPAYIEGLYNDFVKDPSSVDADLRKFFEGFDFAVTNGTAVSGNAPVNGAAPAGIDWMSEIRAYRLILRYRNKGHLLADTNPIRKRKDRGANLDPASFGFTESDLDKTFHAGSLIGLGTATLRTIIDHLKKCYTGHLGVEYKYIGDREKSDWLTRAIEKTMLEPVPLAQKKRILQKLNEG